MILLCKCGHASHQVGSRRFPSAYIRLTDASSSQIEWRSGGGVRVKLGNGAAGHTGSDNLYKLRFKLSDGSYMTAAAGKLHILESVVDEP
jgi:hypothetical protein